MRNVRLTVAILMLGLAAATRLPADYWGDIYVDPLGLVHPFDGAAAGIEFAIPYNQSFKLQARFNGRGDYPAQADSRSVAGIEAGWRFYFYDALPMRGFFLGPQAGLGLQSDTYTDMNGKTGTVSTGTFYKIGLEIGHQWILGRGFVLTPGVTASYIPPYAVGTGRPSENGRFYSGLELNLGWAFKR